MEITNTENISLESEEEVVSKENQPLRPVSLSDSLSLAFHFLYAVDRSDYTTSLETVVDAFRIGFDIDIADDSYAYTLAQGAIEQREELDKKIIPLLKNWSFDRLGCCTRLILRLALWELDQKDAIPNVIINEAIELAKCFAEKDAYKFVNGVLDKISKAE